MRSPTSLVTGLLVALLLAGCATTVTGTPVAAPGPAPTTTAPVVPSPAPGLLGNPYADRQGRFRLTPPAGWTSVASTTAGVAVAFADPSPATDFRANVNVYVVDSTLPLDRTITGARSELRGLTAYASTADEAVTLTDGTPAHLLGGTYRDQRRGQGLRNLQLFAVHDGKAFAVTATALDTDWDGQEPRMRASLVSLTFAS